MMSEFLALCQKRQSCRSFLDKPVEREKLVSCMEAGRLAPSACNSQPWSFIGVQDPKAVAEISKAARQLQRNDFAQKAGAFILVVEEYAPLMAHIGALVESQYFAKGDLGAATAYICLEAAAQGLGVCQIGMFDREAVCKAIGIPREKKIASLLAIGYASDETVRVKTRKDLAEISRFV